MFKKIFYNGRTKPQTCTKKKFISLFSLSLSSDSAILFIIIFVLYFNLNQKILSLSLCSVYLYLSSESIVFVLYLNICPKTMSLIRRNHMCQKTMYLIRMDHNSIAFCLFACCQQIKKQSEYLEKLPRQSAVHSPV